MKHLDLLNDFRELMALLEKNRSRHHPQWAASTSIRYRKDSCLGCYASKPLVFVKAEVTHLDKRMLFQSGRSIGAELMSQSPDSGRSSTGFSTNARSKGALDDSDFEELVEA